MARAYLSARLARRDELLAIAAELREAGIDVVSSWLWAASPVDVEGEDAETAAERNLEDLRRATVLIALTDGPDAEQAGRGGRHVELGGALAWGLEVVVVGSPEHIFHRAAAIRRFRNWPEARQWLVGER